MAMQKPKTFPMLPVGHWWNLREKFKQSIPGVVTNNYLGTALNTKPKSARTNVLPYLKDLGLISDDGKTLELAKAWRDDKQYQQVCKKIRDSIYPDELIAAVPNPSEDREAVERWFANHSGAGIAAVKRMAAIYVVIAEGDISKKPKKKTDEKRSPRKSQRTPKVVEKPEASTPPKSPTPTSTPQAPAIPSGPGVNINLEIHISSDATPDQIDKIFESMAKHIYKK
ncbi:MAG TPA: hypothetical protein ENH84_06115 [Phycisphaerae bacterium]|nr:hypothetical protein [Phycisphaerae bacterium]